MFLCAIANLNDLKNLRLTNQLLILTQIDMIRSFLVLALPLAISAASSNAVAGFDVDDVDFKAKVIESINQFQGNRRKMLNNAILKFPRFARMKQMH